MFGVLKKGVTDFTLKVKGLFASSEYQYVKDLRKVMTYTDGRKCKYPKNYDQIVKSGKVTESKNSNDETIYKLLYGKKNKNEKQPSFELTLVEKTDDRSYVTIDFLVDRKKNKDIKHYDGYYEPFGFSKIDLEKHIPIFEAREKDGKFELTNSSFLAKKGCSINDKTGKVSEEYRDEKGRNGKLLYTSDYKKLSTHFSEIRDQSGNLELDKSLISVPIVFAAGLAKICAKLLTFIPMKLGENLIGRQNPIAKSFGYLFFTPAVAVKNLVNMGATILKVPILLFVANEKKYGDAYLTMWKHQLKECWKEVKSDFNVVTNGERPKPKRKDHKPLSIAGTWNELDARRPFIERELKEQKSGKKVGGEQLVLQNTTKQPEVQEEIKTDHVDKLRNKGKNQSNSISF